MKKMMIAALLALSATSAMAQDRSSCTMKDANPANAEFVNLKVHRPAIGAAMQGYRIEARMTHEHARLSAAGAELKIASVSLCKDEDGKEAVRWLAYSKLSADGKFDIIELPIPKTAKAIRLRSCSNMQGAQCFSGIFEGDFSKEVILVKEVATKAASAK